VKRFQSSLKSFHFALAGANCPEFSTPLPGRFVRIAKMGFSESQRTVHQEIATRIRQKSDRGFFLNRLLKVESSDTVTRGVLVYFGLRKPCLQKVSAALAFQAVNCSQ
jgi:hypothetical protein